MGCGCCVHCVCTGRCIDGDQPAHARQGGVQPDRSFASSHSNISAMPTGTSNTFNATAPPSPAPGGRDIMAVISNLPHPGDQIYGRKSSRQSQPQSPAALTPRVGPVHHAQPSELERSSSGVSLLRSATSTPLPGNLPHSRNPSRKIPSVQEPTEMAAMTTMNKPARSRNASGRDVVEAQQSAEAERKLSVDTRAGSRTTSRTTSRQTSPDRETSSAMPAKTRSASRKARSSKPPPVDVEQSSDEEHAPSSTLRRKSSRSLSSAHARKPSFGEDLLFSAIGGKAAKSSRSRSTKASRGPEMPNNSLQVESNIEIRTWAPTPTIGSFHAPQSRHPSEDEGGGEDGEGVQGELEQERLRRKAERKLQRNKDKDGAATKPSSLPSSASPTRSKGHDDGEKKVAKEKDERDKERAARHHRKLERQEEKARAAAVAAAEAAATAAAAAEALRKKVSRHRRHGSAASAKQVESDDDNDSDASEKERADRRKQDKEAHKRSKSLRRQRGSIDSEVVESNSADDVEEDDHTRRKKVAALAAAVQATAEHRSRRKKQESRPASENEDDSEEEGKRLDAQPEKQPLLVVASNMPSADMRPTSRATSPMPPATQEKSISIGGFTLTRKRSVKFDRSGGHFARDNDEDGVDGRQVGYDGTPIDGGNMADSKRERIKTYLDTVVTSTLKDPRDKHGIKASSRGLPNNTLLPMRGPPPYSASASLTSGMDMRTTSSFHSFNAVRKLIVQPAPAPYHNTLFFLDMSRIGLDGSPYVAFRLQGGQSIAEQHEAAQHKKHGAAARPWLLDSHENGSKVKGQMLFGVERDGALVFSIDVKRRNVDKFVIQGTPQMDDDDDNDDALATFSDALHWGEHDDYRHVYCRSPDGRSLKWYMQEPSKLMRLYGRSDADHGHVYAEARMTIGVPSKKKKREVSREATLLIYPRPQDNAADADDQAASATLAYLCASWWCARQTYDESRVAAAHAEVEMIEMVEKAFEVDLLAGA